VPSAWLLSVQTIVMQAKNFFSRLVPDFCRHPDADLALTP